MATEEVRGEKRSEIRLMAIARDLDGGGEAWLRPVASVDWHEAWDAGIPLDELPDDLRRRVDAEG